MSNLYKSMYNAFQATNPEVFNNEFIYARNRDDFQRYIDNIAHILEIIPGISYLGSTIIEDETEVWKKLKPEAISISNSRFNMINLKFHIQDNADESDVSFNLLYPKLMHDFFFELNDSKYTAIYQIVDRAFYTTRNNIVLKTASMPLITNFNNISKFNTDAGKLEKPTCVLKIFKKDINPFYFLLGNFEFDEVLKMLGDEVNDIIKIVNTDDLDEHLACKDLDKNNISIPITKELSFIINQEKLDLRPDLKYIVWTFAEILTGNKKSLDTPLDWRKKLGKFFTTNSNSFETKADGTNRSFIRIMDEVTKEAMNFISDHDKQDSFHIMIWIMKNIDMLKENDNMSLDNKRVRMFEYIAMPLQYTFNKATIRVINNGRQNTFNGKKRIFSNIKPDLIIKQLLSGNLHRYNNCTSGLDLFSAAMKWSMRGPQSLAENNDNISEHHRDIHPSYIGAFEIYSNSNSDPGLTGNFVPFMKDTTFFNL